MKEDVEEIPAKVIKPPKKSRWVAKSGVERYTKVQQKELDKFRAQPGWHKGARIRRVGT